MGKKQKVKQDTVTKAAIASIKLAIKRNGLKREYVASQVGYTPVHLSRVLNEWEPLTDQLKVLLYNLLELA